MIVYDSRNQVFWPGQQFVSTAVYGAGEEGGGGSPPSAAQSSSRGIRVYIGIGICLALMFIL